MELICFTIHNKPLSEKYLRCPRKWHNHDKLLLRAFYAGFLQFEYTVLLVMNYNLKAQYKYFVYTGPKTTNMILNSLPTYLLINLLS